VPVRNDYFGGNIGVSGLMTGIDLTRALEAEPQGDRYLLPDSCLSEGRFLDNLTVTDLPRPVEIVATDGLSLRRALDGTGPVSTLSAGGCGSTEVSRPERVPVTIGVSR
jgi:hypothetical protein